MDHVKITYKGQFEPLKNQTIEISPELVIDGHVYSSAQMAILDALSEMPEFDSVELPLDLWEIVRYDGRDFLLYWEVVMKI